MKRIVRRIYHNPVAHWFYQREALILYRCAAADFRPSADFAAVAPNSLEQLQSFVATESWHRPPQIVAEFEDRLRRGELVATLVRDGDLASFGWLNPNQEEAFFPLVRQRITFPERSAALYNLYTHPAYRGQGLYKQILNALVSWAFEQGALQVMTAIEPGNRIAIAANETIGFKPYALLSMRRLLGREQRHCQWC